MTPQALSDLHARAFAPARGWSVEEFSDLIGQQSVHLLTAPHAFLLARILLPEAEILTLASDPRHRRQGHARAVLEQLLHYNSVTTIFAEVAQDNTAARALYKSVGFSMTGRRPGYYARRDGAMDALLLQCTC